MAKIFFTGITGILGGPLSHELLKQGNRLVFLARGMDGLSPEDRVKSALNFVYPSACSEFRNRYTVVDGDITEEDLGMTNDCRAKLFSEIEEVWHVAGSISFSQDKKDKIFRTNINGTKNILEFVRRIRPRRFHYISTAYVNRGRDIIFENELDYAGEFINPYEESKYRAEMMVREYIENHPETEAFIYRPSIVVGNSNTGIIRNFVGYYRFIKTFYVIKKVLSRNGDRYNPEPGTCTMHLPANVLGYAGAKINIVTMNYVVDTIMKLRERRASGVYHITNSKPPVYKWLLLESLKVLGIDGSMVCPEGLDKTTDDFLKTMEGCIRNGMHGYIPYISGKSDFDQSNVRKALGKYYVEHPDITSDVVRTLLSYAVTCEFKANKGGMS